MPSLTPDSPYAQYWPVSPTPEQATNALHWRALVTMRAAVRTGGYATDTATALQRRLDFARWLYTSGKLTEFAG